MMHRHNNPTGQRRAFTLVELMVVVFILGLLLTFTVVALTKIVRKVNVDRSKLTLNLLDDACRLYEQDFGAYPPSNDPAHPDWGGGQLLVLYLVGLAGDPGDPGDGQAGDDLAVDDGIDGPGYRLMRGGPQFGPYNGAENVSIEYFGNPSVVNPYFVDSFKNPIFYYVCRNDTYSAEDDPDGPLTDDPDYARDQNGMYYSYDFIMMTAGPDGEFVSLTDDIRTDDITNFLPED
jgi:prepilin-type N-terminal cleavage/methylation domain-containing protein